MIFNYIQCILNVFLHSETSRSHCLENYPFVFSFYWVIPQFVPIISYIVYMHICGVSKVPKPLDAENHIENKNENTSYDTKICRSKALSQGLTWYADVTLALQWQRYTVGNKIEPGVVLFNQFSHVFIGKKKNCDPKSVPRYLIKCPCRFKITDLEESRCVRECNCILLLKRSKCFGVHDVIIYNPFSVFVFLKWQVSTGVWSPLNYLSMLVDYPFAKTSWCYNWMGHLNNVVTNQICKMYSSTFFEEKKTLGKNW